MNQKMGRVIIPDGCLLKDHEISAARILIKHFKTEIIFIKTRYQKTADFLMNGQEWEMKSPTGKGKYNIEHQFQRASKQSRNMVLDCRRTKLHSVRVISIAKREFLHRHDLKKLIIITKSRKIIELSK